MENTKLKKSVRIRLQKAEAKAEKTRLEGKQGASSASLRNVPTSPRKMRTVTDIIRGQRVGHALGILKFEAKVGAKYLEQVLLSAIANWEAQNADVDIEEADLYIKELTVDSAKMLKRLRPAPQGRAHRIRKRSNHITIVVDSHVDVETIATAAAEESNEESK